MKMIIFPNLMLIDISYYRVRMGLLDQEGNRENLWVTQPNPQIDTHAHGHINTYTSLTSHGQPRVPAWHSLINGGSSTI